MASARFVFAALPMTSPLFRVAFSTLVARESEL